MTMMGFLASFYFCWFCLGPSLQFYCLMFQSPTWDAGSSIWIPHESPVWSPSPLALAPAFSTRVQQWVFQTSSPGRLLNIQQFRQAETPGS